MFIERPNRFIAVCELDGETVSAHVKNTGRCRELLIKGVTVILEKSANPDRKTKWSLICVYKGDKLINMDSQAPNTVVAEAIQNGAIKMPDGAFSIAREKTFGDSRFDIMFAGEDGRSVGYLEVKGVTLERGGVAYFPDAPTERGAKHVRELERAAEEGYFAMIVFLVQMKGCEVMRPNDETHMAFGDALRSAKHVRIAAFESDVTEHSIDIGREIRVEL